MVERRSAAKEKRCFSLPVRSCEEYRAGSGHLPENLDLSWHRHFGSPCSSREEQNLSALRGSVGYKKDAASTAYV